LGNPKLTGILTVTPGRNVIEGLKSCFVANGCVRIADSASRNAEGQKYKKGYEVRLVATSLDELFDIQGLLVEAGISFGRPYVKARRIVQPIYGRDNVKRFLELMGESLDI